MQDRHADTPSSNGLPSPSWKPHIDRYQHANNHQLLGPGCPPLRPFLGMYRQVKGAYAYAAFPRTCPRRAAGSSHSARTDRYLIGALLRH